MVLFQKDFLFRSLTPHSFGKVLENIKKSQSRTRKRTVPSRPASAASRTNRGWSGTIDRIHFWGWAIRQKDGGVRVS
jgi:hypothetical protein